MGFQDRDYVRDSADRSDGRAFWPNRKPAPAATWRGFLVFVSLVLVVVKAFMWINESRLARSAAPPPAAPFAAPSQAAEEKPVATRPAAAREPALPDARSVIKCVALDGSTSYVDTFDQCAAKARGSELSISPRQNEADGMSVEQRTAILRPAPQPPETAAIPVAQTPPAPPVVQAAGPNNQTECKALDERVVWLDARARQPLSAWEQDRIREERKKARDRQFELHC